MAMVIDAPIVKKCGDCIGYNRCKGWTDEPYSCPVIGEIPDKHGDLIDLYKFVEQYDYGKFPYITREQLAYWIDECIDDAQVVLEASK